MSIEEAVNQVDEHRTSSHVIYDVMQIGGLAHAIHELYRLRNTTVGIAPEMLAQRQMLLDLVIKMCKNKLKKSAQELVKHLEHWEQL